MLQCHAPPPAHPFIIYIFKQRVAPAAATWWWKATVSLRNCNTEKGRNLYGLESPAVN